MNKQLHEETQQFLKDLDGLLYHIIAYLIINFALALYTFTNFGANWWVLFPMIAWSLVLIHHAMKMMERKKRTKLRKSLLVLLTAGS